MARQKRSDKETGIYAADYARRRAERQGHDRRLLQAITDVLPQGASVLDIGAGSGWLAAALREQGWQADAYDGCALEEAGVKAWDLTKPHPNTDERWDWGLFIEVGEHIPARHQRRVAENITDALRHGLIVSYALPGQRGLNHVSCRTPDEVAELFGRFGWETDAVATERARDAARGRRNREHGYEHKLLVLRRSDGNA